MTRRRTVPIVVLFLLSILAFSGCVAPAADSAPERESGAFGEADLEDALESGLENAAETDAEEESESEPEPKSRLESESASESEFNESKPESDDGLEATQPADSAELPVDVDEIFERVSALLESDADRPDVRVRDLDELLEDTYDDRQDPFHEAMNVTETDVDTENARGLATDGSVTVDPNDGGRADVEQVLVHEYVHAIQFAESWVPEPTLEADVATSTDYRNVETALIEGGAVWVTDQYSARYQNDDVRRQSERLAAEYETAPAGDRYFRAPYHYGFLYADERLEEPTDFPKLYDSEDLPTTTEQLLHGPGLDPDEAEPTDLAVDATVEDGSAGDSDGWTLRRDDRLGELFVRVALETELERDRAVDAAAGWGNDRLLGFSRSGGEDGTDDDRERGYVWVLRWDSPADADAFEDALETVLAERTDDRADEFVVDRRGKETVVVTVGSEEFRQATTVTAAGGDSLEVVVDDT